mmetsp:Transcript_34952/g.73720  ORF Transcript_34952/g.73720 Transcript_34952/m.73720 type:complete len:261 (-) Transcript_34952:213-995(-)
MVVLDTNLPSFIVRVMDCANGLPLSISFLNMSPLEKCVTLACFTNLSQSVPFPDPGPPMTRATRKLDRMRHDKFTLVGSVMNPMNSSRLMTPSSFSSAAFMISVTSSSERVLPAVERRPESSSSERSPDPSRSRVRNVVTNESISSGEESSASASVDVDDVVPLNICSQPLMNSSYSMVPDRSTSTASTSLASVSSDGRSPMERSNSRKSSTRRKGSEASGDDVWAKLRNRSRMICRSCSFRMNAVLHLVVATVKCRRCI